MFHITLNYLNFGLLLYLKERKMTREEFIEWIEGLELQTLTDELKQDIIENFESTEDEGQH